MKITIQSLHFTSDNELKNVVTEKVRKLSHLYDHIDSAKVCLKISNPGITDNKICEIRLAVPGHDLFALRQRHTFEEALTEVIDVLQLQLKKLKERLERH